MRINKPIKLNSSQTFGVEIIYDPSLNKVCVRLSSDTSRELASVKESRIDWAYAGLSLPTSSHSRSRSSVPMSIFIGLETRALEMIWSPSTST